MRLLEFRLVSGCLRYGRAFSTQFIPKATNDKRSPGQFRKEIMALPVSSPGRITEESAAGNSHELERDKVELYRMARKPFYERSAPEINTFIDKMLNKYPPCMHLFNIVLYARITLNHVKGMQDILSRMEKNGLGFNQITYNNLIGYYRNSGRPEEAEAMYQQMMDNNVTPTIFTYTTLVSAFSRTNLEKAKMYFSKMLQSSDPIQQPDIFAYNTMVGAYMYHKKFAEADGLVQEMSSSKIPANFITFKIIIEGLLKDYRVEDAWKMYRCLLSDCKEMRQADFIEIYEAFLKAGCSREAMQIFLEMEDKFDAMSSRIVFPAMMYALRKKNVSWFKDLVAKYLVGNEAAYRKVLSVLQAECKKRDLDPALLTPGLEPE